MVTLFSLPELKGRPVKVVSTYAPFTLRKQARVHDTVPLRHSVSLPL